MCAFANVIGSLYALGMDSQQRERGDEEAAVLQIEEVTLNDIGSELVELARRLQDAGEKIVGKVNLDESGSVLYTKDAFHEMTQNEVLEENTQARAAFRSTLSAMRHFRREYDRWERLTAEYALTEMGYSQREAAKALGVATSTINRWAQHPLKVQDYS